MLSDNYTPQFPVRNKRDTNRGRTHRAQVSPYYLPTNSILYDFLTGRKGIPIEVEPTEHGQALTTGSPEKNLIYFQKLFLHSKISCISKSLKNSIISHIAKKL